MAVKIKYFEDEAGEHRYAIAGGNGENMVTSEGYTTAADARRGLADLLEALAEDED